MRKYFVFLLLVAFSVTGLFAADVDNQTVSLIDETGSAMATNAQPYDYAIYSVDLIHTGAAEDNVTSQAINTSGLELVSIQMLASAVTTRDVNISFQGSAVLEDTSFVNSPFSRAGGYFWDGDFDDYSADEANTDQWILPVAADTVDGVAGATKVILPDPALTAKFIRVRSDGQTGNLATTATRVYFIFKIVDKSRTRWNAYDAT